MIKVVQGLATVLTVKWSLNFPSKQTPHSRTVVSSKFVVQIDRFNNISFVKVRKKRIGR